MRWRGLTGDSRANNLQVQFCLLLDGGREGAKTPAPFLTRPALFLTYSLHYFSLIPAPFLTRLLHHFSQQKRLLLISARASNIVPKKANIYPKYATAGIYACVRERASKQSRRIDCVGRGKISHSILTFAENAYTLLGEG